MRELILARLIGAFRRATKAVSTLEGVTLAMMRQITGAAYDEFKAQLAEGLHRR